jgi:cytochrome c2
MFQHLLLILVAAPLIVFAAPSSLIAWGLPKKWRKMAGQWWHRRVLLQRTGYTLSLPGTAWVLHSVALWIWHSPGLYQRALEHEGIHALEHASFFGTALLFWWVLARFAGLGRPRAASQAGAGVLYIFSISVSSGLFAALITFAPSVWYPVYTATAPAWGLSALEDQQLAGVIMWIPMGIVYLAAAMLLLGRWLHTIPVMIALIVVLSACRGGTGAAGASIVPGGDAERGRQALQDYGCISCHTIPGVPDANAWVGPPLNRWADREYIAGSLTNDPENLIQWIRFPQEVEPGTAMPDLGVGVQDARDMSAYLYTLGGDR